MINTFMDMPQIKISMLGISGSGKSSFISGLYHSVIESPIKSPNIILSLIGVEDDGNVHPTCGLSTRQIMKNYNIKDIMSGYGTYDKEIKDFNFNFRVTSVQKEMDMEIPIYLFDYKGGTITDETQDGSIDEKAEILLEQVKDSDVILLILDSIILANYAEDIIECKEKTGASYFNMIINSLSTIMDQANVTVLTVLTKTDSPSIPSDFKENNFEKLCLLAKEVLDGVYTYAPFLEKTKHWQFGMIPVTAVGEGNTNVQELWTGNGLEYKCDIKEGAKIKQNNIDLALIYSIYNALHKRYNEYSSDVEYLNEVINSAKKIGFDRKARRQAAVEASQILSKKNQFKVGCGEAFLAIEEDYKEKMLCEIK